MKWRDHARLAWDMARVFKLDGKSLADGSIEPDKRREVVHTWPKARRAARTAMYRARKAFLRGKMEKCARYLGIVSHYIEDGMVHGTMDTYSHSEDHSLVEGELGSRADIAAAPVIDTLEEGFVDGEFVFQEISSLVQEGLSSEKLGRALSLLGSAVMSSPDAPPGLIESNRRFLARIRNPAFKIMALISLLVSAGATYFFQDPLWLLPLPFFLLLFGSPFIFRTLARWGWVLVAGALLGFLYYLDRRIDVPRLALTLLLIGQTFYLCTIPDLSKWGAKWYRLSASAEDNPGSQRGGDP